MASLLPDYSSASDSEPEDTPLYNAPVAEPTTTTPKEEDDVADTSSSLPKGRKRKMKRTTLHLPPNIQKLLESGASTKFDSESDDDQPYAAENSNEMPSSVSLLAQKKRLRAEQKPLQAPTAAPQSSTLPFLPAPKHEMAPPNPPQPPVDETTAVEQPPPPEYAHPTYDPPSPPGNKEEEESNSKLARKREREIERQLLQGNFNAVADRVVDIQGPDAHAWEAPVDATGELKREQEVHVSASFWNAHAGMKVSTGKPSRLQRQKHQLNQLAFDAKSMEQDLLEQKGRNMKTKAETHAKYGW